MPRAYRRPQRAFASVEAWMEATGTNQKQLAKLLHMSQPHLCNILKGHRKPSLDLAFAIARLTNVPVEVIDRTEKIA